MATDTPTTLKAEQERVLALLKPIEDARRAFFARPVELIPVGQPNHAAMHAALAFQPQAESLARAYLALLAAHAEALERERWIPVEERLPEAGTQALFMVIGGQVFLGWKYSGGWEEATDLWSHEEVTHWKKLPPPPAQAPASAEGGEG